MAKASGPDWDFSRELDLMRALKESESRADNPKISSDMRSRWVTLGTSLRGDLERSSLAKRSAAPDF